jgi:hypothetical protein
MQTYTPINQYAAYINCPSPPTLTITFAMLMSMNVVIIPPEYENIKDRILENIDEVSMGDKNQLINDVGIATAVKVRLTTPILAHYL